MPKPIKFAIEPSLRYITTAGEDGAVDVSSRIVARVDTSDKDGSEAATLIAQANMVPELLDLLGRYVELSGDVRDQRLWPTLGPLTGHSRALLARVEGGGA